jgi:hypothetical protein
MAMKRNALLFIAVTLSAVAAPAFAQTPPNAVLEQPAPRQGYYASLGVQSGVAFAWDKGDALKSPIVTGVPIIRLGEMLTPRFSLGLRLAFLGGSKSGSTTTLGGLQIETGYRVWKNLAVSAGVGAGYASVTQKKPADPDDKQRGAYGALYDLHISYDFFPYKKPFSGGLAITPSIGTRFLPGDPVDALAIVASIDFIWWTGLPKNQLDLPPDRAF